MEISGVDELERAFASAQEIGYAVTTSSPAAALRIALLAAGVAPGHDVAVASYSPVLAADAVREVGARPLFADVDPVSATMTPTNLRAALTQRTRAVVAVDLGGVPVDLDDLRSLTDARDVVVIELAAYALGATYRGRPVGAGADLTVWSLDPDLDADRVADGGGGGVVSTSHPGLAEKLRELCEEPMTEEQASAGLALLAATPARVAARRERAARYSVGLSDVVGLRPLTDPAYGTGSHASYDVEVEATHPLDRDQLLARLHAADLPARRGIEAIHRMKAYEGTYHRPVPTTERLDDTVLSLPLGESLTPAEQDRVIDVLDVVAGTPA